MFNRGYLLTLLARRQRVADYVPGSTAGSRVVVERRLAKKPVPAVKESLTVAAPVRVVWH